NFLLAIAIYWGLFFTGTQELLPVLGTPTPNTPAAMAGIVAGEKVQAVDGVSVPTWAEFRWEVLRKAATQESVELTLINESKEIAFRRLALAAIKEDGWQGDGFSRLGLQFYRPHIPATIASLLPGGAAAQAGLLAGDTIVALDGRPISSWLEVVDGVGRSAGKVLQIEVQRGGERLLVQIVPTLQEERGQKIWRIGIGAAEPSDARHTLRGEVSYGFIESGRKA